jgi:hypothetical protein
MSFVILCFLSVLTGVLQLSLTCRRLPLQRVGTSILMALSGPMVAMANNTLEVLQLAFTEAHLKTLHMVRFTMPSTRVSN